MKLLFVTGRLAEPALRQVLANLALPSGLEPEVLVLPISVAALMTTRWVARHLSPLTGVARVVVPGHCRGELGLISEAAGVEVERGPVDLRDLPRHFGAGADDLKGYGDFDIQILAEINHATHRPLAESLAIAEHYREAGADLIDVGCTPGEPTVPVGTVVSALKERGLRVSVDSFESQVVREAVSAGAELVLSVNKDNLERAADWGVEVVVVPDEPGSLVGLEDSMAYLDARRIPYRLDPVLDPIAFGFAESLGRYLEVRRRFPEAPMMMGIGNLTELTDVDSAGINMLLISFCQELGIRSVLTTEVINWARTSVREIDLARRLSHFSVTRKRLPKHVDTRLLTLRDARLARFGPEALSALAARVKDENWRIFAEDGTLIAINGRHELRSTDPFELFDAMGVSEPSHAFYLGYELMKAKTALDLSKNYRQDQALDWGYLTREEVSHMARRRRREGEDTP